MPEVPAREFSLQATLTSGQTFRWQPRDDGPSTRPASTGLARDSAPSHDHGAGRRWYYGFIGGSVLKVRQEGDRLLYETSDDALTPERVTRYFALDLDLPDILRQIDVDMQIHDAIVRYRGLRVLRQDGWEVLASFILASFNNIKRIEGMVEGLCQAFGTPVALNGFRSFGFPKPETVAGASERRLRSLGFGYRAPYLRATARLVADERLPLTQLVRTDYDATKRALLQYDGVGDKVADCVALFGFEKYEAFPLDVWMERAMRYYFRHRRATRSHLHAYARKHFGLYAGYAQQYLYHYIRNLRSADSTQHTAHR